MNFARLGLALATFALSGCGGATSPSMPGANASSTPPGVGAGVQPTIVSISPNVVSTTGTWGTITGGPFQPGATLNIGGVQVPIVFRDSNTIQFAHSGAHPPGAVDVVLTNPGARPVTLGGGYTYAPAESFDANGDWIAHADARNDYVVDMHFTIRDNALVSLSCGIAVQMPTVMSAQNGQFLFAGADGFMLSGTLVSRSTSSGHVNAPGCGDGTWWAERAPY